MANCLPRLPILLRESLLTTRSTLIGFALQPFLKRFHCPPTLQCIDSLDPEGAAVTYQVEVYSDSGLTTLIASVSTLPGTPLTTAWPLTPALTTGGTYYWRVRGSDGQVNSAWSATQHFRYVKLASGDHLRFAARPRGLNGLRVATIGSLGGLTGGETEAIFFYHTDHLGTPLMMTDRTGQVVWQGEYLPFGEPFSVNEDVDGDGVTVTNNLIFPGQYFDQETMLYYNMARAYGPKIGRYVEADPIGLNGGRNIYGYSWQNPINLYDFGGLDANTIAYGEIRQFAIMNQHNFSSPAGLADAKASLYAACSRGGPRSCSPLDGSITATEAGDIAAWINIVNASGGTDRSGGGNIVCIVEFGKNTTCKRVHKCTCCCDGVSTEREREAPLNPVGSVKVYSLQGGTIYFYDDPLNGWCSKSDQERCRKKCFIGDPL
jgi:RHS repeat-associated protein